MYMCVVLGNSAVDFFPLALALGIYFSRQINFQSGFFLSVSNPGFLFKMLTFMFSLYEMKRCITSCSLQMFKAQEFLLGEKHVNLGMYFGMSSNELGTVHYK